MRVLIAGISSNIGRKVTELLLASGHEVQGIDRRPRPALEAFSEAIAD